MSSNINLTLSMGVSDYPNYSRDVEELIHQADRALYMAKEAGRNNVQIYREAAEDNLEVKNLVSAIPDAKTTSMTGIWIT